MSRMLRIYTYGLFLVCGLVLYISLRLEADPSGIGTHQQLGLAPCGFVQLTQYPCPMCGMTTSFTLMSDGCFIKAVVNQPFGVVLYCINMFIFIISGLDIIAPNQRIYRIERFIKNHINIIGWSFLGGLLLSWFYKILIYV